MASFNSGPGAMGVPFIRSISSEPDPDAASPPQDIDDFGLFTTTQFFDFESGQTTDFQPPANKTEAPTAASPTDLAAAVSTPAAASSLNELNASLLFTDFNMDFSPNFSITPQLAGFPDSLGGPLATATPTTSATTPVTYPQPTSTYSPTITPPPTTGEKRKASDAADGGSNSRFRPDDAARIAAEEDKRRRNTAASARFRHKKKQREQEMERKAKESEEKITQLEGTVQTLVAENKWLKNMILEKSGNSEDVSKKLEELTAKVQAVVSQEARFAKEKKKAEASPSKRAEASVKQEFSPGGDSAPS